MFLAVGDSSSIESVHVDYKLKKLETLSKQIIDLIEYENKVDDVMDKYNQLDVTEIRYSLQIVITARIKELAYYRSLETWGD